LKSVQRTDTTFLGELVRAARARVGRGYYDVTEKGGFERRSLVDALGTRERIPIVAEVKFRSPAEGRLSKTKDVGWLAQAYQKGGAAAVSVLTEPDHFEGHLEYLSAVKNSVDLAVLMKDIVVDERQVTAARNLGADAVLIIASAFGSGEGGEALDDLIGNAHENGLEVLLEVHDETEYGRALSGNADVVGINNRDLRTLGVSLGVSKRLLKDSAHSKPVICESGIRTREEIDALRRLGADGFLLGSALMRAKDPEGTLRSLSRL
jgi:indole-3-glycerol phosphate synthase